MIKDYEVIKSKRKSVAIEITREGKIKIRVPKSFPEKQIQEIVNRKEAWIIKHLESQKKKYERYIKNSDEREEEMRKKAAEILPLKIDYYSKLMGLEASGVKITGAKTRFGSCNAKNGLCFSWRLMLYPERAIDYVVVHELAHIKLRNHSKDFYLLIEEYMPDYKERIEILNGEKYVF